MSENIQTQEQPADPSQESTTTTAPEQPPTTESTTTTTRAPVEIGTALVIERPTEEVKPSEKVGEPSIASAHVSTRPEIATITSEKDAEPVVAPIKEKENQFIPLVGVAKELPNQSENMPVRVGLVGSIAIGASLLATKLFHHNKK